MKPKRKKPRSWMAWAVMIKNCFVVSEQRPRSLYVYMTKEDAKIDWCEAEEATIVRIHIEEVQRGR